MTRRRFALPWLAAALAISCAGCRVRSLDLTRRVDAGPRDAGPERNPATDPDGSLLEVRPEIPPGDANPDGCVPRAEQCNGLDDNCNGQIDEGFDLNTDQRHCGRCGNACTFPNARAACSVGRCRLDACNPGFVDVDRLELDGCECQISNGGVESCDDRDNNCNGQIDEGFDLDRHVDHCGVCGRTCRFPRAAAICMAGMCRMGACEPGFVDLDRAPANGCEYPCTPSNGGVEICDGKDNDCDGDNDESDARAGMRCFPEGLSGCDAATGQCRGTCALGTWACLPGGLVCRNAVLPRADVCDGMDNNCDGVIDDGIDLMSDPRACGRCDRVCALANAVNGCVAGECTIRQCRAGFVDLDKRLDNGCEYACSPDGPEACDGKDNDCDGQVDLLDPDLLYPAANFCGQKGECGKGPGGSPRYSEPTFPVCTTPAGAARPDWICNYPATVQLSAPNQTVGEETLCDGLDNDCDGSIDEHAKLGEKCTDPGTGECKRSGVFRCQADKTLQPLCDTTGTPPALPGDEACDGKDNDCDGLTDESWDTPAGLGYPVCAGGACRGARDDLVHVTAGGKDTYIYRYEATRVDATAMVEGAKDVRACSRGGLLPWSQVNYAQAQAACAAAGMRLCRTTRASACSSTAIADDEWGLACHAGLICGAETQPYPYGCSYDAQVCNGFDRGIAAVAAAGASLMCTSPDLDAATAGSQSALDMSGNLAEWTDDCRGTLTDGTGRKAYTLRGGAYDSIARALRCDFMSLAVAENFSFANTGFRCCSSCAPGLGDCGPGRCVSLGTDPTNCGACGRACAAGQACQNGLCR